MPPTLMTETSAQFELDDAMRATVYRCAYRLMRHHEDAMDATQEVMLKWVCRRSAAIENPNAWLRRATINHCIDRLRAQRRSVPLPDEPAGGSTPVEKASDAERRERIAQAVRRLSPQQQSVVMAKIFDRETFAVIARDLGISVSSVKTHYVRALQHLRQELAKLSETEP